jgi:hypothetical protein
MAQAATEGIFHVLSRWDQRPLRPSDDWSLRPDGCVFRMICPSCYRHLPLEKLTNTDTAADIPIRACVDLYSLQVIIVWIMLLAKDIQAYQGPVVRE